MFNFCLFSFSSPLVPAYLSRGPPVLQHPERVVPLSDCERFEPHYQPNVALAPIPAPAVPLIPAPLVHHRRHHHERRRHNHRSLSPNEKSEPFPVNVKLEKPSSPVPPTDAGFIPVVPPSLEENQEGVISRVSFDEKVLGEREEEESTTVTSSTVNVEPVPTEVCTSSPEVDFSLDGSTAIELEKRLVGLELPPDVLELIKRLTSENGLLRRARLADAQKISRLRSQLEIQQLQTVNEVQNKEDATNASAADSTEGNEKPDEPSMPPSDNKDPELEVSNENKG